MGKWLSVVALGLLVGSVWIGAGEGTDPYPVGPLLPVPPDGEPDGAGCVAGCSAADDHLGDLAPKQVDRLLARFASEPMAPGSEALEALLFHHRQLAPQLAARDELPLDAERAEFLRAELAKSHAWLDVRVVDAQGVERVRLEPRRVELGVKQHVLADRLVRLQPLEVSGTVKRVGVKHLWARL